MSNNILSNEHAMQKKTEGNESSYDVEICRDPKDGIVNIRFVCLF